VGVLDEGEAAVFMDVDEGGVDGGGGHEGVARLGEGACGKGEGGDEAAEVDDAFYLRVDFRIDAGAAIVSREDAGF